MLGEAAWLGALERPGGRRLIAVTVPFFSCANLVGMVAGLNDAVWLDPGRAGGSTPDGARVGGGWAAPSTATGQASRVVR